MKAVETRRVDQADLLLQAFSSFNEISGSLEAAYRDLASRVEELSAELERSNYYLTSLLENLPCGVLVVNADHWVTLINQTACRLFQLNEAELPFRIETLLAEASFSDRAEMLAAAADSATEIHLSGNPPRTLLCCWSVLRGAERILVVQDVTALRRLEERIRDAERLAAMGEVALEVAHEIRNPLGALELFASLLTEEGLTLEERRQYAENIRIGIRSLNTVVNNMLCLRRTPRVEVRRVRLGSILEETGELMRPLLQQRRIVLTGRFHDSREVSTDPELLRQIFTNLLTNAVQALAEGGHIELNTWDEPGRVIAEVADDGVGIPQQFRKLVFDSGFSLAKGGTGLGLAIVKRLVDALGAEIELDSEEGRGTSFRLVFPWKEAGEP